MTENNQGVHILETFINSGLHQIPGHFAEWPKKKTVSVCLIKYSPDTDNPDQIVTKWNIPGTHAELRLIDCIKVGKDLTKIKSITIYSNHSPCTECSVQLMKANFPDLQIKFSSLYNIKRPSCARSTTCKCHELLDKKDETTMSLLEASMKHSERFRMLTELDAWPFQKEDWDDLINLLVRNDDQERHPTSDLHKLRYGVRYGDWRNGEDEKMKADYLMLRAQICQSTPNKNTSSAGEPPGPSKGDQATGSTGDGKSRKKLF